MSKEVKKFVVEFYYENNGKCIVEATSKEEARTILHTRLANGGPCDLKYDHAGRDYNTTDAVEIPSDVAECGVKYGEVMIPQIDKALIKKD